MIISVVVVAGLLGAFGIYRAALSYAIQQRQAELRDAGVLMTREEINDSYVLPPAGQNAADIYLRAFAARQEPPQPVMDLLPPFSGTAKYPGPTEPYTEAMLAAMREYLAINREERELLREASAFEQSRYPIDMTQVNSQRFVHLGGTRKSSHLLSLNMRLATEDGDNAAVADAFVDMLSIARSLEDEPTLVSHLVRISIVSMAVDEMLAAINRTSLNDEALQQSQVALAELDMGLAPMRIAMRGETAMCDSYFDLPADSPDLDYLMSSKATRVAYRVAGLAAFDRLAYLNLAELRDQAFNGPTHELPKSFDEIEARRANVAGYCILTQVLLAAIDGAARTTLDRIARYRALRIIIAVERFRLAEGRVPDSLVELIPTYLDAVPVDPYVEAPMSYTHSGSSYIVYSVGRNGKDDGAISAVDGDYVPLDVELHVER